jgi:hypothetical protein
MTKKTSLYDPKIISMMEKKGRRSLVKDVLTGKKFYCLRRNSNLTNSSDSSQHKISPPTTRRDKPKFSE